jgi:hypothetical protein
MTDKPIPFRAPMIRALLAGTKTQHRLAAKFVKPHGDKWHVCNAHGGMIYCTDDDVRECGHFYAPIWAGDRLWVREAHYLTDDGDNEYAVYAADEDDVRAHNTKLQRMGSTIDEALWRQHAKLRPSIHMPRWASRLTLIVTDVRVQRLQEISDEDAQAEGVERRSKSVRQMWLFGASAEERAAIYLRACRWEFEQLWNSINGPDAWAANPWVCAISFEVHRCNIDALERATGER